MIDANIIAKNISARKVAKKHDLGSFDKKTVDAKLKVNFNNGKTNQGLSVQLKMKKDEGSSVETEIRFLSKRFRSLTKDYIRIIH